MQALPEQWWSSADYSSFWNYYRAAEEWRTLHPQLVAQSFSLVLTQRQKAQCDTQPTVSRRDIPTPNSSRYERHNHQNEVKEETVEHEAMEYEENVENEEMDEEYLEFRKKTLEHRQKRDAKRNMEKQEHKDESHWIKLREDDYVDAGKIGVEGPKKYTLKAPDERTKNQNRREQAKKLYGEMAEKILAMETSLEMRFTDEHRRKQPAMWPNIPLRF
ncbi:unnamed protein product [Auanema sp. JU1783]|nr:unnamed protein product [Auanema sp. JU1783]